MFCPVGYRSVAELWKEFLDVRLESIYTMTVAGYNRPNFSAGFTRGSPLDICEHIFLKSLCEVGLHLASPTGDVVRTHIQLKGDRRSILTSEGPYQSMEREAYMRQEKADKTDSAFRLFHLFKPWCYDARQGEKWSEAYQTVTSFEGEEWREARLKLVHHTLPIHFTQESYLVSDEMAPWSTELRMAPTVAPILEHFNGWALCLDEGTYQGRWQEYLFGKVALYPTQEQMDYVGGLVAGRPRMEEARSVFEAMGGKGALSWDQVASRIELQTGAKPSHKSLRNWRDELKADK